MLLYLNIDVLPTYCLLLHFKYTTGNTFFFFSCQWPLGFCQCVLQIERDHHSWLCPLWPTTILMSYYYTSDYQHLKHTQKTNRLTENNFMPEVALKAQVSLDHTKSSGNLDNFELRDAMSCQRFKNIKYVQ